MHTHTHTLIDGKELGYAIFEAAESKIIRTGQRMLLFHCEDTRLET
jgi:hypothetical protein